MLQLVLIAIVLTAYAGEALAQVHVNGPAAIAAGLGFVLLPLGYTITVRRTLAALGTRNGPRRLRQLDRATLGYQIAVAVWFALAVATGWLTWLRDVVGDLVLIDEALAVLPPLGMIVWQWVAYYPVDRRLRESALIGRIDAGGPVYGVWTCGQYLLNHARHHFALVLGPIAPLLAWAEWLSRLAGDGGGGEGGEAVISQATAGGLTMAGAAAVFVFAPLLIVRLWHTQPLPAGEIRATLEAMCRRAGVKVRELLVWHSHGGIVNAAVMGLIAPLRYVLLSDGLLDQLRREHVEAVMAHELGHVKNKHMPTLAVAAIASLGLIEVAARGANRAMHQWNIAGGGGATGELDPGAGVSFLVPAALLAALLAAWVVAFGWVSRRVEREADVFAVRTLVRTPGDGRVIDQASAGRMIGALGEVASVAHVDPRRPSWRHGSIAWRQAHLASLVGRSVDDLPIDRTMRVIRVATLAALVGLAAAMAR